MSYRAIIAAMAAVDALLTCPLALNQARRWPVDRMIDIRAWGIEEITPDHAGELLEELYDKAPSLRRRYNEDLVEAMARAAAARMGGLDIEAFNRQLAIEPKEWLSSMPLVQALCERVFSGLTSLS